MSLRAKFAKQSPTKQEIASGKKRPRNTCTARKCRCDMKITRWRFSRANGTLIALLLPLLLGEGWGEVEKIG